MRVTVLMAVRNARAAVRLTVRSFLRHTAEPVRVLVADNGSTDGAAEETRLLPGVEILGLADRARGRPLSADARWARHSATLDELATRVRTPYLLTLDSDVEFVRTGWLTDLLELADREKLAAVGEHEPGVGRYQPRLAPHLLLARTAAVRALGASLAGYTVVDDPAEGARFAARGRPAAYTLSPQELAGYPSARFFPPGAGLLATLQAAGAPWRDTPPPVRSAYRHLGHMSWGGTEPSLADAHRVRQEYVHRRLAAYRGAP